jgi:hypothetical protein
MRTCQGVDLDVTHYGELTLVFLEGVASRSPHGSAMCDKLFCYNVSSKHRVDLLLDWAADQGR